MGVRTKGIAFIGLSALMMAAAAQAAPLDLQATISPSMAKSAAGSGRVLFSLHNPSSEDVLVLRWETALLGVHEDLFDVTQNGRQVPYVGRHYKRGMPTADDYVTVKAGATLTTEIDLAQHYDMRAGGSYQVQFVGHVEDSFSEDHEKLRAVDDGELMSNVASLYVTTYTVPESLQQSLEKAVGTKASAFVSCSTTRQSSINSGVSAAKTMASSANSYLAAGTRGTRYTKWFGTYSATIYSTLKSNFTKIADALNNKTVTYHCDCTDSAYAWVYPNQPYNIHLCNAFWNAPTSGTDSKGGTIIHELSHFDIVGNTDDLAYGQTAAAKLAKQPTRAIKNADSHEYFAENTPAGN